MSLDEQKYSERSLISIHKFEAKFSTYFFLASLFSNSEILQLAKSEMHCRHRMLESSDRSVLIAIAKNTLMFSVSCIVSLQVSGK